MDLSLTSLSIHFRSSVGPHFAKTRAMIFAIIGFIFLAAGIGVTVGTLDLAKNSGGKGSYAQKLQKTSVYNCRSVNNFVIFCKRKKIYNLFTHEAPKSSLGTRSKVSMCSRLNWNLEMLVFVAEGKLEKLEKNQQERTNMQQTQPFNLLNSSAMCHCTPLGLSLIITITPLFSVGIYVVWIGAFVAGILNLIRSCYYCTMTVSSIEGEP